MNRTQFSLTKFELFVVNNLIWFINIMILAVFTLANPRMLSFGNLVGSLYAVSMVGFLVFAQAIALISASVDLSVGAIALFSSTIAGLVYLRWVPGTPFWLLILLMVVTGACVGLYNGFFISKIRVNAFLQTLGTYIILYGLAVMLAGKTLFNLPDGLLVAGGYYIGGVGGVPLAVVILAAGAIALHFILGRMPLGRKIYAIGSNARAARACGINVHKTTVMVFVISGILSALSGLLYTGYVGCIPMTMAMPDLFPSFAGAIIGGVSLTGGRGRMTGIFGGVALLGILEIGLTLLDVPAQSREAINGLVLVAAILINTFETKMKARLLTRLRTESE